jgi:hypothetical protein
VKLRIAEADFGGDTITLRIPDSVRYKLHYHPCDLEVDLTPLLTPSHRPCWNCGREMDVDQGAYRYQARCSCGVRGPHASIPTAAWELWDKQGGET